MLEIKTSLDWNRVESEIRKLGDTLPMFRHDIKKICEGIRPKIVILSNLEIEDRRTHSSATARRCREQADKINQDLKLFKKFHLMALLAQ